MKKNNMMVELEDLINKFHKEKGVRPNYLILGTNDYLRLKQRVPDFNIEVVASKKEIVEIEGLKIVLVDKENYTEIGFDSKSVDSLLDAQNDEDESMCHF